MFKVTQRKDIVLIRGDTGRVAFTTLIGEKEASEGEYTAVLSVKSSWRDDEYAFQRKVKNGVIEFKHEDTQFLKPGEYLYDIEIKVGENYYTEGPHKFIVKPDITVV